MLLIINIILNSAIIELLVFILCVCFRMKRWNDPETREQKKTNFNDASTTTRTMKIFVFSLSHWNPLSPIFFTRIISFDFFFCCFVCLFRKAKIKLILIHFPMRVPEKKSCQNYELKNLVIKHPVLCVCECVCVFVEIIIFQPPT